MAPARIARPMSAFATLVMKGGDGALGDITERRLPEPERWDKEARHVL